MLEFWHPKANWAAGSSLTLTLVFLHPEIIEESVFKLCFLQTKARKLTYLAYFVLDDLSRH